MKSGVRALGVAASDGERRSVLAGAVVRADRVVDGLAFATCTVGGTDATDGVIDLLDRLARDDVQHLLLAGVAPAWFNLFDLDRLHDRFGGPVCSVAFEPSEGLEPPLREHFDGEARRTRLKTYRSLPPRHPVDVGDRRLFVRAVGCPPDRAADLVTAHTPESHRRPEPLRVARLAARAGRAFRPDR